MTKLSREMKRVMRRVQAGETLIWNWYVTWEGGKGDLPSDPPSSRTVDALVARGLLQSNPEWIDKTDRTKGTRTVYTLTDEGKALQL